MIVTQRTITFDDLPEGNPGGKIFGPVPNGYQGFDWVNTFFVNGPMYAAAYGPSAFHRGVVSSPNVITNPTVGSPGSISRGTTFSMISLYAIANRGNGVHTTFTAFLHGIQVAQVSVVLDDQAPVLVMLNFNNVDQVTFIGSGGTNDPDQKGVIIDIDNILIDDVPSS